MEHIRLRPRAIFKARYGTWTLIDTQRKDRERFLIEGGAERILLDLFGGMPLRGILRKYDVRRKTLETFLGGLAAEGLIEETDTATDSTSRCFDVDPPLDCLHVLLTNACNLRCVHCYVRSGSRTREELTGGEWIHVMDQARRLGAFEICVTGGEATMHREFPAIAEYIASIPTFSAHLNTNGTRLTPECADRIARTFSSVQISLDGETPLRHDAFRGKRGAFDGAVRGIRALIGRGVDTGIGFSLTAENLDALDGVVALAERIGVSTLNIGLVADVGRARTNGVARLDGSANARRDALVDAMLAKLIELSAHDGPLRILLPFRVPRADAPAPAPKRFICDGENRQILYVMADGSLMPCDKLPADAFACGNVRDTPLAEAWASRRMSAFKLTDPARLAACGTCPHLALCGGSCVARAFHGGGSLESPDWISCAMAERIASMRSHQ